MTNITLAARSLSRDRSFFLVVVLTMAVAIGANAAILSVYDQLVLHPVTIQDPSSLVAVWFNNPQRNVQSPSISMPRYEELRDSATWFDAIALSAFDSFTLTDNGDAVQLNGLRVSPTFFPTLRIAPARGRNFTPSEDVPNGPPVCIISHELWQSQFGGREPMIGRTIQLNGTPWDVIGIMPPKVSAPFGQVQVYAPRVAETGGLTPAQVQAGATYAQPIARLKPGTSLEQVRSELAAFSRGYKERHATNIDANNVSEPRLFVDSLVSTFQPTMYTLLAAVGCVLLIACANVASLFLSRLLKRRKEIAVRLSLGATRGAVVRQFLAESLLFSMTAGLLGILFAAWALGLMQPIVALQLPPNTSLTLQWRALAATAGIAAACAFLTGLFPAVQASNPVVVEQLKDTARGSSTSQGSRLRKGLIVAEVMLSVMLLVAAGLLLASFVRLQNTTIGFEPRGAAAAFVGLPPSRYATASQQTEFFDQVIAQLRAQPGVSDAAVALSPPMSGGLARTPYGIAGQPLAPPSQRPLVSMNVVSDTYFHVLDIPMVDGRAFNRDDRAGSNPVCIVNETFAARAFAGQRAIGQALLLGPTSRRVEIVGVMQDVKSVAGNVPTLDEAYFPLRQLPRPGLTVIAKTSGDASMLQSAIKSAVAAVDKTQAVSFFATLESNVAASLATQRLVATLTGVVAALACLAPSLRASRIDPLVAMRTD